MNDKIKELKDLLFELDSKHSVSVPNTQQNINDATKKIVKLFAITSVVVTSCCKGTGIIKDEHSDECYCDCEIGTNLMKKQY